MKLKDKCSMEIHEMVFLFGVVELFDKRFILSAMRMAMGGILIEFDLFKWQRFQLND